MKKRILIVDDSSVVRTILTRALNEIDGVTVIGAAVDGVDALTKITELNPDLVTLDIEMPNMNGIETMQEIRKRWPYLPVIMFSTLTERGAQMTMDALLAGARDYVAKPTNSGSIANSMEQIKAQLGRRINALVPGVGGQVETIPGAAPAPLARTRPNLTQPITQAPPTPTTSPAALFTPRPTQPGSSTTRANHIHILGIGSSTGGPDALAKVLSGIPGNFPVPIAVVQHMPPMFTKSLADRLNKVSALTVTEAIHGEPFLPGHVYIAPGDWHMEVAGGLASPRVHLHQNEPENYCRPAVDVLFRSLAKTYGKATHGLILTGMGADGTKGSHALVEAGAEVYAQDRDTSVVWGMPRAVTDAGLVSKVLPLDEVAAALVRRIQTPLSKEATR